MSKGHKAVCVIAWPAGHSRSPLIHNYWIKQHKLDAEYRREAVPPDKFDAFVEDLHGNGYVGANITVPHKEAALKASEPDDRARAVGAANTLWYDDDTLRSTNTDVEGCLANLDVAAPGWDRGLETAVVLGAGGGARAVVFALLRREVGRVYVINRTRERAEALKKNSAGGCTFAAGPEPPGRPGGPGLRANRPHWAWSGSRRWISICVARHRLSWPTLFTHRWRRGCWPRRVGAACERRMASACCCTRPSGDFSSGSACALR